MAGLTLRDVFIKGGDLFPGTISPPEPEPDADCENREDPNDEELLPESDEDDESGEDSGRDSCGKAGRRGACGGCSDCADYGDMKYHEMVDRELEERP